MVMANVHNHNLNVHSVTFMRAFAMGIVAVYFKDILVDNEIVAMVLEASNR